MPRIAHAVEEVLGEAIALRRDIHQHPELSFREFRTTEQIIAALQRHGLNPHRLESTGAWVDIGSGPIVLGIRADIDALPVKEETGLPYASVHDGIAHACGHDIHTAVCLGTAITLHRLLMQQTMVPVDHLDLTGRIRVIFQPAEEKLPGGSLEVIRQGVLQDVPRIIALHADPSFNVGTIGTRIGAITSATDTIRVTLTGRGGHTSRPQQTQDVVYALAQIAAQVPAILGRRIDVRSGAQLTWGHIQAGHAPNAIPATGQLAGTLRTLDVDAWDSASELLDEVIGNVAAPFGVKVQLEHIRGVPPVVNNEAEMDLIEDATRFELGSRTIELASQSMGGEDFAWMTKQVPGAMFRLGTRTPSGPTYDLHQGDYNPDERAIGVGMQIFTQAALRALVGAA
ncbi:MAG TPA: amidohydrolase [Enteractinococcus helveticum]|uniref:Amidohydrolase n=1 Tax=Enteractinococcus helveticum TaxID=1837282 RepID=A0A921FJL0_9MICC|nr:amidohydrolase [Enteractinococcus helveticum]HJF13228.1 amidohydrolase [Enteractinococcus helveticum]